MKNCVLGILVLAAFFSTQNLAAQNRCGAMENLNMQLLQDPTLAARRQLIEQQTAAFVANPANYSSGSRAIITIPVVVHVVYNTTTQNISTAQIQSQIDRLNLDFRKLNTDWTSTPSVWQSLVADYQIEFCLASRDPNGNTTTGIIRKSTTTTSFSTNDNVKRNANGGDDAWPAASYLNLWVCNLSGGVLGYAQFPGGAAATDGVVITYTGFGSMGTAASPYNLGRTATHEIGHWLNLYHIWGDDGSSCSGSDQVGDTPNQGAQHYGCPSFPSVSCTNGPNGDMWMNYMDYTDDRCMYMFTNGQYARTASLFATGGSRASLLNSVGCLSITTPPVANFSASPTTTCTGVVQFTDLTTNSPTTWSWNFGDGTTSTAQNPSHIYTANGTYTVTLTTTNAYGSNPKTLTNYITINKPAVPTASNVEKCGPSSFALSTTATAVSWLDSSGTKVSSANPYNTPVLTKTTTYWLEDTVAGSTFHVGAAANTVGSNSILNASQYLIFNVNKACVLQSVYVYASGAGNRTIRLLNNAGTTITSLVINLPDGGSRVTLNWNLATGTGYQIGLPSGGTINLSRNSTGAAYPYNDTDGNITITGNTASDNARYYWFYDWIIQTPGCVSQRKSVTAIVHPNVTATTTITNAGCGGNNGAVGLNIVGTAPYTYAWSNSTSGSSISNLAPGTYTATITDSYTCSGTVSATVTGSGSLSVLPVATNISCFGRTDGTASISAPTATTPVTYHWGNGETTSSISGLAAGNYPVTVTDGTGCSATSSQTVAEPTQVTVSATKTDVACYQAATGSAIASANGGNSGYTYLWSNNDSTNTLSNATANTYTVTATDANQCTAVATLTITEPTAITSSATTSDVHCFGEQNGTAQLTTAGGTGAYTYQWCNANTSASPANLPAGTCDVTITDANGCNTTTSVSIAQPSPIHVISSSTPANTGQSNGSASIDNTVGGVAPYTFSWNNGANTQTVTNLAAATYTVTITDATGCSATTTVVVQETLTGIQSVSADNTFLIYPNPAKEKLNVSSTQQNITEITLNNMLGQTVIHQPGMNTKQSEINISMLPAGTYILQIKQGAKQQVKRIVVE